MAEFVQVDKTEEMKAGDKLRLTFNVLSLADEVFGFFSPTWQQQQYEIKLTKAIEQIQAQSAAHGYRVLAIQTDPSNKTIVVDIVVENPTLMGKGLGLFPFIIAGYVIIAIVAAVGLNMALDKVERIVDKPIPALGLLGLGGILLFFYLSSKFQVKGSGQ